RHTTAGVRDDPASQSFSRLLSLVTPWPLVSPIAYAVVHPFSDTIQRRVKPACPFLSFASRNVAARRHFGSQKRGMGKQAGVGAGLCRRTDGRLHTQWEKRAATASQEKAGGRMTVRRGRHGHRLLCG